MYFCELGECSNETGTNNQYNHPEYGWMPMCPSCIMLTWPNSPVPLECIEYIDEDEPEYDEDYDEPDTPSPPSMMDLEMPIKTTWGRIKLNKDDGFVDASPYE